MDNIDLLANDIITGANLLTLTSSKSGKEYKVLELSFTALDEDFTKRIFLDQAEIAMLTAEARISAKDVK